MTMTTATAEEFQDESMDPRWLKAEAFRRIGVHQRAAAVFGELWEESQDPSAGWRRAFCLRKLRQAEEALSFIETVVEVFPDHPQVVRERVWCLHDARLRPAVQNGGYAEIVEGARAMVEAGADELALQLAVFAAIKAARARGHWEQVAAWCDLVDPTTLNNQQRRRPRTDNSRSLSDRERWYYAKLKASIHLGEFESARSLGFQAVAEFPDNHDFHRWVAAADRALGFPLEAVRRLLPLTEQRGASWYLVGELALCQLELGEFEKAWRSCRKGCRAPGPTSSKVGLYETAARIALGCRAPLVARDHLGLCLSIRSQEEWSIGERLLELEAEIEQACGLDWEDAELHPVNEWLRLCQHHWNKEDAFGPPLQLPSEDRKRGRVTDYHAKRPFAFLAVEGERESYRVQVSDLPENCRYDGADVEFTARAGFDRKRNRPIQKASEVQPAKSS